MSRTLLAIIVTCCLGPALAAAPPAFRDLSLEQAIRRLGDDGLSVLYSSDLIKPDMTVQAEPAASEPRAILAEILAPYDLAVVKGPNGSVLLVRAQPAATGRIVGRIRRLGDGAPVGGVSVRLGAEGPWALSDAQGRFAFTALPPGRYPVAVADERITLAAEYVARVGRGRTTSLRLEVADVTTSAIDEIVVNASQYELGQLPAPSLTAISAGEIQSLPSLGDDALRSVTRLPGTAAADVTAKANIRGGEADETLVRFDGLRLYNPFHLKDFQSVFSSIDPGLVSRMDVSTGGYPARFGSRMSGVIDIQARRPAEQPYREISLSFLNAAALASGGLAGGDGEWLLSARRSNLDLLFNLLEPDLGSPTYTELYGRLGRRIGEAWSASGNFLVFDDDIELAEQDREEVATADYRDAYLWLRLDYARDGLSGSVLAAHSDLESDRVGSVDQPGVSSGELLDQRDFTVDSLQADWSWDIGARVLVQLGADWRNSSGHYDYSEDVEFEVLFLTPGAPTEPTRTRALSVQPDGQEYGAYASLRFGLPADLTAEAGVRWDRETLTPDHESRFSPRLSLLYDLSDRSQLRASWGRFLQPQAINELQVSDGVTEFQPAQRADHLIASFEHQFRAGLNLRIEAYRKDYSRLRPRFENILHTLVIVPELKPDRARIVPEAALAEGVELMVRSDPLQPFSWWVNFTRARVEDTIAGTDVPRAWDQRRALGAGLLWRWERWEWSLAGSYRSGWPTTAVALAEFGEPSLAAVGPRNAEQLGNYLALDTRLARDFRFSGGDSLTVFLEVTNLTDRVNQCCVEYEINDDIGEPQLETERVDSLRIVPLLGFTWRF